MDFMDLIDKNKIAERQAALKAEWNTPEKVASRARAEQARKEREAKFERGKVALGIIRYEDGPHYSITYFDANNRSYTRDEIEAVG